MTIPTIKPYTLPHDLPSNKVAWQPDPQRAVLLIHDMQDYFVEFFQLHQSPIVEVLAHINAIRKACYDQNMPVIYTAQPSEQTPQQRGLLQDFWGSGLKDSPSKSQIVSALAPSPQDIVLTKWRYSAFQRTELLQLLQQQGRDQLIICGIYAHIGCLMTAGEAFMNDIQPFLVADAIADFSLDEHLMALRYAAQRCAKIIPTQILLANLTFNANPLLDDLQQEVAALLQLPPTDLTPTDNLLYFGLDSIRLMTLVERWRRKGIEISFVDLAERPTLTDWSQLLTQRNLKLSL